MIGDGCWFVGLASALRNRSVFIRAVLCIDCRWHATRSGVGGIDRLLDIIDLKPAGRINYVITTRRASCLIRS
jgi:hypothetical protein